MLVDGLSKKALGLQVGRLDMVENREGEAPPQVARFLSDWVCLCRVGVKNVFMLL
jgi:hypothetical protein